VHGNERKDFRLDTPRWLHCLPLRVAARHRQSRHEDVRDGPSDGRISVAGSPINGLEHLGGPIAL
jgi:hypothetical protein